VKRFAKWMVLFSPTIAALGYFGLVAQDRYVSEAQFIVRTASKPANLSGLGAILSMSGLGRAQDDVFAVQSFLGSRDAVTQLEQKLPLRSIFGRPEADLVARYPSVFYGKTHEELHSYLKWMVTTIYSSTTGLTTLRVQAFRPEDARDVAVTLLSLGEDTVNRLNQRIQTDAVASAQTEVKRNEDRLVAAQVAITRFRNSELLIDAGASSVVVIELIARLGAELAQTESQIREITAGAATNPALPSLRRRAEALQAQINQERAKISSSSGGLADKLAVYERLVLDREFAKQSLATASRSLESAQQEGRRQQLYLERVVEPASADYPMAPERLRMMATVFGMNIVLLLVGWLFWSGVKEHATASDT
jgi:capsular polysaccharide transport system permease protein